MKSISITLMVVLAAGFTAPAIQAQITTHKVYVAPEQRNAAIVYWQAFGAITPELSAAVSAIEWNDSFQKDTMTESFNAAAVMDDARAVALITRAARMKNCNFECQWEDGFMTLLPHLSHLRSCARLLRLEARKLAIGGDVASSIDTLISIRRIAEHTAVEPIAISKLVAIAINALACDEMKKLAGSGLLTAAQRDALITELRRSDLSDIYAVSEFFIGERSWIPVDVDAAWIRKNFLAAVPEGADRDKFNQLSDETIMNDIPKVMRMYDALMAAWRAPDAPSELKAVATRIESGEFGVLAGVAAPSVSNIKAATDKACQTILDTITALEQAQLRN